MQVIDYHYWERKAEITCETNSMSKVDPKGDLKNARNPKAAPKGKAPENPKSGPDLTRKLGKDGKLTPPERQHRMDNSLCLFCGKTGHIAKECPKSMAITARARAAVMELQESFVEELQESFIEELQESFIEELQEFFVEELQESFVEEAKKD